MTANIGKLDVVVRVLFGLGLIIAPWMNVPAIWSSSAIAYGSMAVGGILIATAAVRFCPLYRILGISSCKV